jgi:hypothetical protein
VIAKKVEAAFDPADEGLVGMFLQTQTPNIWLTAFTAPRSCQRVDARMRMSSMKRT